MIFNGKQTQGFYGILWDFMGFYGGLMGFYGGLMGFYGGLMGFNMIYPLVMSKQLLNMAIYS